MQITDIKIRKIFDEGPMKAIVSVTFDGQLAVHDIKVINARDKFFIVMPSHKNPDDTYRDIVHPINAQFRAVLEEAHTKPSLRILPLPVRLKQLTKRSAQLRNNHKPTSAVGVHTHLPKLN